MSQYKLIAFDMDGTLLDSDKKIRQDSIDMIHAAADAGKIVCLSTGRCMAELKEYMEQLSVLQYIIGASGAFVFDVKNNRELSSAPLPVETVRCMMQKVKDMDLMMQMLSEHSIVQKDKVRHMEDYQMGIYKPLFESIALQPDDLYTFYEQNPIPLYKLNLYCKNPEERALLRERFAPLGLVLVNAETTSLECSAPHVSKGQGLRELCEYLHISMEQTIAVGDADNNLDILKQAGLAVAMGNANENVKNIADVIVNDNDHGGCAQTIRDYLLERV